MASAATAELEKVLKRVSFLEKNVINLEGWLRENFGYLRHLNFETLRLPDVQEPIPIASTLSTNQTRPENVTKPNPAPLSSIAPKQKFVTFADPISTTRKNSPEPDTSADPRLVTNPSTITTSNGSTRKEGQSGKTNMQVAVNKPKPTPTAEKTSSEVASSRQVQGSLQKQVQGQAGTEGTAGSGSNQSFALSTTSFVTVDVDAQKRDPRLGSGNKNVQPGAAPPPKPVVTEFTTANQLPLPRISMSKPAASEAPAQPARMSQPKPAAVVVTPTPQTPHSKPAAIEPSRPSLLPPTIENVPLNLLIPKTAPSQAPAPRPNPPNMLAAKRETLESSNRLPPLSQAAQPTKLLPPKPATSHVSSPTPTTQPRAENVQHQSEQNWTNSAMEPDWQNKQFQQGGNWNQSPAENEPRQFYSQTRLFPCKKCNASFHKQNILDVHVHKVHKKFLCRGCPKGFDTREQLNQHYEAKHSRQMAKHANRMKKQKRYGSNLMRDHYQSNAAADDSAQGNPQDPNQPVSSTTRSPNYAGQNIPVVGTIFHNNFTTHPPPPLISQSFRPQYPGGTFYEPGAPMMNFNAGLQPSGMSASRPHDNIPQVSCQVCSKVFGSIQSMLAHRQTHKLG